MKSTIEVITFHVEAISRGDGRSAVQLASYCARDRLRRHNDGLTYDYTRKHDLVHSEILLPEFAPLRFGDHETLWNEVELIEKNKNARLARAIYFTLPNEKEFNHEIYIRMAREFIQESFVSKGMCADFAIHDKGDGNPHVHVMLTTRSLDEKGRWLCKQRKNYLRNPDGSKIYDPVSRKYAVGSPTKTNNWDDSKHIEDWRKGWANVWNKELERLGLKRRVTHMSYARQGSKREPTKHLGRAAINLEERGVSTRLGNKNRAIEERNKELERQHQLKLERVRHRAMSR